MLNMASESICTKYFQIIIFHSNHVRLLVRLMVDYRVVTGFLFCPTRLAQALPGMAIQCCCEGQNNNMLWRAVNASNDSV